MRVESGTKGEIHKIQLERGLAYGNGNGLRNKEGNCINSAPKVKKKIHRI